jgi:hypothetical protein
MKSEILKLSQGFILGYSRLLPPGGSLRRKPFRSDFPAGYQNM